MNHDVIRPAKFGSSGNEAIDELTGMIQEEVQRTVIPPQNKLTHVNHPVVDEVGRLSAEAMATTFENSARAIEDMGKMLVDSMKDCRKATVGLVAELQRVEADNEDVVQQCLAAAEIYRGQAKELYEKIQGRAIVAAKVRTTVAAMIEDLA